MTITQFCIFAIIALIILHYFFNKKDVQGCNLGTEEDDDVRRDALLSKIDKNNKDRATMKQHLTDIVKAAT